MAEPLTGNAGQEKDVKDARRMQTRRETRRREFYRQVLATPAGRFVFWDLLADAGVFRSVWSNSGMEIHRNVGRQDFGHKLHELLILVSEEDYLTMEREARALAKRDDNETRAARTPSATAAPSEETLE
jgi:hypothetical protein